MRAALLFLKNNLADNSGVVALTSGNCYAVAAPQDAPKNFVAYNLSERDGGSKDATDFDVRISLCNETIDGLVDYDEGIRAEIESITNLDFEGTSEIVYIQDEFFQLDLNYVLTV